MIIQGPGFFYERAHHKPTHSETHHQSKHERDWAIAGFAVTMVSFIGYLIYQVRAFVCLFVCLSVRACLCA